MLFHSILPTLASANRQPIYIHLPDIFHAHSAHVQNTLPISSPQRHPAIFYHSHPLQSRHSLANPSSLTLPLSKRSFGYTRNHSPVTRPIDSPQLFYNFYWRFTTALCARYLSRVTPSLLCSHSSKALLFWATSTLTSSLHFLLCPPTRLTSHTSLAHSFNISLNNLPLRLYTLDISTSQHFMFSTKLSWYARSFTLIQFTHL